MSWSAFSTEHQRIFSAYLCIATQHRTTKSRVKKRRDAIFTLGANDEDY